jgi:hypothetical protein
MNNQPKITYRSDSTGSSYQMMQRQGTFAIQVLNFDNEVLSESPVYAYAFPWRKTIDMFFDIVTTHINENVWIAL